MEFYNLKVKEVITETIDTKVITFELPTELKEKFKFTPGQYVTLSEEIKGNTVRRSYSICSAPWEDSLSVGVKLVRGGRMSSFIHEQYQPGKVVQVSLPEGKFILKADEDQNNDYYFIAAGSGITPIKSMVENVLENEPLSRCYILYGSRTENNIIFKNQFDNLSQKYKGQIEIIHTLSRPSLARKKGISGLFGAKTTTWTGEKGRIDPEKINTFLENHPGEGKEKMYYLCGPGTLIETAEKILLDVGVDKKHIFREFFVSGDAPEPKSMEEAHAAKIRVTLNDETFEYASEGKVSILEELIQQKKNPPYSCTSGACSSCMAKVKNGKAEMEVCYALDDDEVESGYILTCQARAVTDELEIEFE